MKLPFYAAFAAAAVLLAAPAWAEIDKPPATPAAPAKVSENEALKLQLLRQNTMIIQLQDQVARLQVQLVPVMQQKNSQDLQQLMGEISSAHPGFTLDPNTGELIPIPQPTPPAKAADILAPKTKTKK